MMMSSEFVYQWQRVNDGVVLKVAGGTFSIPSSTSLLDAMCDLECQLVVFSKYSAKIVILREGTGMVMTFFDTWGDIVGLYIVSEEMYYELITEGYSMMWSPRRL